MIRTLRRYAPAVLPALLASVLYLLTLSRNHSADSLLYAIAVESGDPARLFDPYHLLLHPAGWLTYRAWQGLGWAGGALLPLQVLNALGGGLAVGLMYALARRVAASPRLAGLVAAGFAVSGATWLFSVEAEFVTIPVATQLLVLWGLLSVTQARAAAPAYPVWLGLGIAFAAFAYLTGLLLVPVAVVGFLLHDDLAPRLRRRQAAILVATVLLAWLPLFVALVARWAGGQTSDLALLATGGSAYGELAWRSLPHAGYAFLRALALFSGLGINVSTLAFWAAASLSQRFLFGAYYALVLVLAAAPLLLLVARWRCLWARQRRTVGILLAWTALYAAFAVYWVPGGIGFWIPVLAAWWLLVALLSARRSTPARPRYAAAVAAVVLLAVVNASMVILPRHDLDRNRPYHVAASLAARTSPRDLVVTRASDLTYLNVAYFCERDQFHLSAHAGAMARQHLQAQIARVRDRGGQIWVVGNDAALCPGCTLVPAWQVQGETIWELAR